jgi:hypothetical protein
MRRHYRPVFLQVAENPARAAAQRKTAAAVLDITNKARQKRPA